ncbi:UTP--glucose-1-phosphate uridylyltransferase GalU [Oligella urethralis]|uniref:UTP--glucose-1-phosphate uridylyltransferase n=2 Tax=Oligella urethralis TaxID=90245 RepID=A0A095ZD05_9BURK|nr:UTP--glucose-1-phosphate uridylyltransferase GalU [Oligella urethralis]AVL70042.1 UTP--glucose-1-phosphate uridylyltransferase [Oligella urethralis]KGF32630.1 UTP--glucose-1-phosphate uridylyltransferase [Oligella urethralis DNF00040]MDK6203725.1 UTP--glucose-1-phosphate uridylyltransferase GalU [Oligella urethralis]WOS36561.1 UTP--glucose-1-phosphate uridylyltransferase [Oligella urethralis]SPY07692.1 UTP--glucose-1-phosphate uridylyltransferase [Oligella urethralis]
MNPVRKAVFPVAGLGTRFLPATKAMPKEMLPVVDKPLIQYAVEEAVKSGITDLIFITGRHKRSIEDHFDFMPELEHELEQKGKHELLEIVRGILPTNVNCIYIRQPAPLGLGHAVLCAEPVVGNEPFAVLLADDLIDAEVPVTQQLIDAAHAYGGSVLGTQVVPQADTKKYGIIAGATVADGVRRVEQIVEKPAPEQAPSTSAVVGRYVLEPEIFEHLRHTQKGAGNEIQLTDGIASMLQSRQVFGFDYEGVRYDCGSKEGFFQANIALGQKYHGLSLD